MRSAAPDAWVPRCRSNTQSGWFVFSSGSPREKRARWKLCNTAFYNPKCNGCNGIVSSGHVPRDTHWESDFRPKGNQRDPSGLPPLYPPLAEGVGGVGRGKSPAKQVCSPASPPPWTDPTLVFELPFWVVGGMVGLWWTIPVGGVKSSKVAIMSGSPAEMHQFTSGWWSDLVTHLTSSWETEAWSAQPTIWCETVSSQKVLQTLMNHWGKDVTPGHSWASGQKPHFLS